MTLMAGPVDVAVSPTAVNTLATHRSVGVVRATTLVTTVPAPLRRRRAPRVPGVPAARGVRRDEPEAPPRRAPAACIEALVAGDEPSGRAPPATSTTSTSRSRTCPPRYTSRRSTQIFQGNLLARGRVHVARAAGRPERITRTAPADRRGRARRHLRARPDHGRTRAVHPHPRLPPPPPPAGRRRALRGVQRAPLGEPGLPGGAQLHRGEQLG